MHGFNVGLEAILVAVKSGTPTLGNGLGTFAGSPILQSCFSSGTRQAAQINCGLWSLLVSSALFVSWFVSFAQPAGPLWPLYSAKIGRQARPE